MSREFSQISLLLHQVLLSYPMNIVINIVTPACNSKNHAASIWHHYHDCVSLFSPGIGCFHTTGACCNNAGSHFVTNRAYFSTINNRCKTTHIHYGINGSHYGARGCHYGTLGCHYAGHVCHYGSRECHYGTLGCHYEATKIHYRAHLKRFQRKRSEARRSQ